MIRYYAYYSCGGYKDMYLGDSSIEAGHTYFLPLLALWEAGGKPEYAARMEMAQSLDLIRIVSQTESFGFPAEAKSLFSHGGYRMIYRTLRNGSACLAVRDISDGSKDEEARETPYTMVVTASGKDVEKLDAFALQSLQAPQEAYEKLSGLFAYDPKVNGVSFAIGALTSLIESAPAPAHAIAHIAGQTAFMLLDTFGMKEKALSELGLAERQVDCFADMAGHRIGQLPHNVQPPRPAMAPPPIEKKVARPKNPVRPVMPAPVTVQKPEAPKEESIGDSFKTTVMNVLSKLSDKLDRVLDDSQDNSRRADEISRRLDELRNKFCEAEDAADTPETLPAVQESVAISSPGKIEISYPTLLFSAIALIIGLLLGALIF